MRNATPEELLERFPSLLPDTYKHTSDATARYNCVAFANDDHRKWWQAGLAGGRHFWPDKVPDTLDGWTMLFARQGYTMTDNRELEHGIEKVAIYVDLDDFEPSHVAISDGTRWMSKLGRYQDIAHDSLEVLEGSPGYGVVERVLQRSKPAPSHKKRVRNSKVLR